MRAGLAIWLEIGNPRHHSHKQGNTGERAKGSCTCPSETAGEKTSPCEVQKREALQPKCGACGVWIYKPAPSCHCTLCTATTSHLDNSSSSFSLGGWLQKGCPVKASRTQPPSGSWPGRALDVPLVKGRYPTAPTGAPCVHGTHCSQPPVPDLVPPQHEGCASVAIVCSHP